MAGYTDTPLPRKLGIKEGSRLALIGAPESFVAEHLAPLPEGAMVVGEYDLDTAGGPLDVIVFFTAAAEQLNRRLPELDRALAPAGGLWVAWPKKASGVPTDVDFQVVQSAGLDLGLVDNKVCAVTDVWSGLRFVVRKENRAGRALSAAGAQCGRKASPIPSTNSSTRPQRGQT